MSETRDWWGTVRYADEQASLRVVLIASYKITSSELAGYPVVGSSGPKDYLKNQIWAALNQPGVDEVYLVRGRGPMFALVRHGKQLFDLDARPVVLEQ